MLAAALPQIHPPPAPPQPGGRVTLISRLEPRVFKTWILAAANVPPCLSTQAPPNPDCATQVAETIRSPPTSGGFVIVTFTLSCPAISNSTSFGPESSLVKT